MKSEQEEENVERGEEHLHRHIEVDRTDRNAERSGNFKEGKAVGGGRVCIVNHNRLSLLLN